MSSWTVLGSPSIEYKPKKRPAGTVRSAMILPTFPRHVKPERGKNTLSQRIGLAYERQVFDHLRWLYGDMLKVQPWIQFQSAEDGVRRCQPDALLFQEDKVLVFEVKNQMSLDSWWQLSELYLPVVSLLVNRQLPVLCVSISHNYSAQVKWPVDHTYCDGFSDLAALSDGFAAIQWRKTKEPTHERRLTPVDTVPA